MTLTENIIKHLRNEGLDVNWVSQSGSSFKSNVEVTNTAIDKALLDELRIERDRLIALTDWRFRSDLTPSQAWIDYCQALRDLPATATPALDENGNLTGVTWPTPPTE